MGGKRIAILIVIAAVAVIAVSTSRAGSRQLAPGTTGEIHVTDSSGLQDALDRILPGGTIVLDAGRTYEGPFVLRHRDGDPGAWITIRGDAAESPANSRIGRRIDPDHARLPKLVASSGPVIAVEPGAHHYHLTDLEIAPSPGSFLTTVVDLGAASSAVSAIPHDFVLERLYVHGDPQLGSRRGVALNSASTTIANSYFADFKERGNDSQAICGWNGPGPYTIENNHLEAAGENLMFGGGDPSIANLVPSDIVVRGNELVKPLDWRTASPDEAGWTIKNLLELKNARRVLIERNLLEHTWTASQVGFAVLFTPRNQDGGAPWSIVEDVTFRNNVIRHVAGGIDLLGRDDIHDSQPLSRVSITNNLFEDVSTTWGVGRLFQIVDGTSDVTIDHNTAVDVETALFAGETVPHTNFVFTNNIVAANQYGIVGTGTSEGLPSLDHYFPGAFVRGNAIVGNQLGSYPSGNLQLDSLAAVGFLDPQKDNYGLSASSTLRRMATDGGDIGADMRAFGPPNGGVIPRASASLIGLCLRVVFWGAAGLVVYVYIGYPLVLWAAARTGAWPIRRAEAWTPDVTVVVVAYNEGARIRRRIENLEQMSYGGRRSIVVVSDGSTDDTVEQARAASSAVRIVALPARQGKPAALNHVWPLVGTDIVILADARQRFAPDAIQHLVADFADPHVGAVSGQLVLEGRDAGTRRPATAQGAGLYWRYETCIRQWESVVHSSVGVTGAITALRRSLFDPLPPDTVVDDLLIPLRVMRRGYRVVFEPRARAYDGLPASARDELARKVRTLAGTFQLFAREPWLLWPSQNQVWLQTISHKALRLMLPLLFGVALAANVALAASAPLYALTLAAQLVFYALGTAGWLWPSRRRVRWVVVPYTICFLSYATIIAFLRVLRGGQAATWERAAIGEPA